MPTRQTTRSRSQSRDAERVWTDEERTAMQESARERKAAARRDPAEQRADGERDVREKIAQLPEPDRTMAERIHAIVMNSAPTFVPRTYYGMPAYAKEGRIICFFKPASKFKERYSTFGFEQAARIDDGAMWPVAFALTELTADVEARIVELVKHAAG